MYVLVLDLETTGLLHSKPYIVSIAYKVFDHDTQECVHEYYEVVKPHVEGYAFPKESVAVHGITTEYATTHGVTIQSVIEKLHEVFSLFEIRRVIAHNIKFDISVLCLQLHRFDEGDANGNKLKNKISNIESFCTMEETTQLTKLYRTSASGRTYMKFPKLTELYHFFFNEEFNAHHAKDDVDACARCYFHLKGGKIA